MNKIYDVVVIGGGTAGVAAAISAARNGADTLLIEQNSFLGGTMTGSLVTPMMKNNIKTKDGKFQSLTTGIYAEILDKLYETGNAATHSNGNQGWFNPEMMKCILDDLIQDAGVKVVFNSFVLDVDVNGDKIQNIKYVNKSGLKQVNSKFFIDATGDADIAHLTGIQCESEYQALSLRFNMSGVDLNKFGEWVTEIDKNTDITCYEKSENDQILITTAYTSQDMGWKLKPLFDEAVEKGVIKDYDADYFQIFSIPGQDGVISFNCPRIHSEKVLNPLDEDDISFALIQGRKQIRRLAEFCKQYLKGFEKASICQIAPQLGVRSTRRILGEYVLKEEDILTCKKFDTSVAKTNYPIDVHSKDKEKNVLHTFTDTDYYEIPLETTYSNKVKNLYIVGKAVSSTYKAQASLRIQPNCIQIGELVGKHLANQSKIQ